jgi:hypothetical protein
MVFLSRTQVLTAFGAVMLALFVLDLVRRRKLSEEYSFLWVVASLVIAVLGFSTPVLQAITHALGMLFESSTVFAVGLAFATVTLLYLSVKMSRLTHEHQVLTREVALMRHAIEEGRGEHRGAAE